jgi:hypothetical protein
MAFYFVSSFSDRGEKAYDEAGFLPQNGSFTETCWHTWRFQSITEEKKDRPPGLSMSLLDAEGHVTDKFRQRDGWAAALRVTQMARLREICTEEPKGSEFFELRRPRSAG